MPSILVQRRAQVSARIGRNLFLCFQGGFMKKGFLAALGLTVALGFGVAQGDPNAQPTPPDSEAHQSAGLSNADFVTSLRSNSDLSTFADLFERSGLATELFEGGPVTLISQRHVAFTAAGYGLYSMTYLEVMDLLGR